MRWHLSWAVALSIEGVRADAPQRPGTALSTYSVEGPNHVWLLLLSNTVTATDTIDALNGWERDDTSSSTLDAPQESRC
jgi:hypothetical protein